MIPRSIGLAFLLAGCGEPRRSPPPVASAEPLRPSPAALAPGKESVTERPAESAEPAKRCDVDLPAPLTFFECYPRPRTLDYPDCREFHLARVAGDDACPPARLSLGVTGFQSIADELRVEVRWEAGPPRRAKLFLERVEGSLLGNDEKPGTWMGTLVFDREGPRELLLGPGMRRYTDQTRAPRRD